MSRMEIGFFDTRKRLQMPNKTPDHPFIIYSFWDPKRCFLVYCTRFWASTGGLIIQPVKSRLRAGQELMNLCYYNQYKTCPTESLLYTPTHPHAHPSYGLKKLLVGVKEKSVTNTHIYIHDNALYIVRQYNLPSLNSNMVSRTIHYTDDS